MISRLLAFFLFLPSLALAQTTPTLPTEPTSSVSTTRPGSFATTCTGTTKATVQTCLNTAAALTSNSSNHEVVITAGSSFAGELTLPARGTGSTGWIVLRSSGSGSLAENTRVSPSSVSNMATITFPGSHTFQRAIETAAGAHHYWIIGLEISATSSSADAVQAGVDFGGGYSIGAGNSRNTDGHHFVVDRCYIHGSSTAQIYRGVILNGYEGNTAILDSYISDIHTTSGDTQAVWIYVNKGPILIQNNYLEAGTENIMTGGTSAEDSYSVPSDIKILRNTIQKTTWYKTGMGAKKALIEFKYGKRILVEGNTMIGNWNGCTGCEEGYSFRLTVRDDDGSSPYVTLEDLTIRYNKISDTAAMYNMLASDNNLTSGNSKRIYIHDNLWYDMSCSPGDFLDTNWGAGNAATPGTDYTITHNTTVSCDTASDFWAAADYDGGGAQFLRLKWRDNIFSRHANRVFVVETSGSTTAVGTAGFDWVWGSGGYFFDHNCIVSTTGSVAGNPSGNFWPTTYDSIFTNVSTDDYTVKNTSACYLTASDGLSVGANIAAIDAAMAGSSGSSTPPTTVGGITHFSGSVRIQ